MLLLYLLVAIYVTLLPLTAFFAIRLSLASSDSVKTLEMYGFLYKGYQKRFWYWEMVIVFRKLILGFLSVFMISSTAYSQGRSTYTYKAKNGNFNFLILHLLKTIILQA